MADRFPSLDDFSAGDFRFGMISSGNSLLIKSLGQTEPLGNGTGHDGAGSGDDFLARERALLGDDASQFASAGDNSATVQDGNDGDLLGGGESYDGGNQGGEEITEFESSFPAVDTRNEVSYNCKSQ